LLENISAAIGAGEGGTMAGIQVQVIRRTKFTAPSINNTNVTAPIAQLIDTLGWRSGLLVVRVYANALSGTGYACEISVANSMVSGDDPQTMFTESTALAAITIDTNLGSPPVLKTAQLYQASVPLIGRYVNVSMKWSVGSATLSGDVTIGVDLIGRDT